MTQYICGPEFNLRTATIDLPVVPEQIGILISGGIDSAILYYLLLKENITLGNIHTIVPFVIPRKEGSKIYAVPVIEQVNKKLNLTIPKIYQVGDNTLPEPQQVSSGIRDAYRVGCKNVYVGVIENLPEHEIGWTHIHVRETATFKVPLAGLNKGNVISLVKNVGMECLFHITYGCVLTDVRCNKCNGCNERAWGFAQNNMTDPGIL